SDGNLTTVTDITSSPGTVIESYTYGSSTSTNCTGINTCPHVLSSQTAYSTTTTLSIDKHGRQLAKGSLRTITSYKDFDLPKTVSANGQTWTFSYDASGGRARKVNGPTVSSDWTYVGGLYEKRVDNGTVSHVFHVTGFDGAIADLSRASSAAAVGVSYIV